MVEVGELNVSIQPKEEQEEPTLDEDMFQEYAEEQDEGVDEEGIYEHDEEEQDQENYDEYQNQHDNTPYAEPSRPLGQFMTPQIVRFSKQPRLSLGPGAAPDAGPRRVRVVAPWKVGEIQVPVTVKEEGAPGLSTSVAVSPSTPLSPVKREKVSDEEREVSTRARVCAMHILNTIRTGYPCSEAFSTRDTR